MSKYTTLFSRRGLSLDRLRTLVAISDEGGLSKAARGAPAQMSQYSRQIKELETFFGVKLADRRGRQLFLNEQGKGLVRVARETLEGLDLYASECRNAPQTLSVGANNSVLEWWLLPRLAGFKRTAPRANLMVESVRTSEAIRRLVDMTLDLAVVRSDAVTRNLKSIPIMEIRYDFFIPAKLADGIDRRNILRRLPELPLATSMGGQFRSQLQSAADKYGISLNTVVVCNSFTQAARLVRLGNAAAFLPHIAAAEFSADAVVQVRSSFLADYVRQMSLAWHPRRRAALDALDKIISSLKLKSKSGVMADKSSLQPSSTSTGF